MVASASSSNTQCPSPRCRPTSASVARVPAASSTPNSSAAVRLSLDPSSMRVFVSGPDDLGGFVAGSDRALDGRGKARIGPVARERKVAPAGGGLGGLGDLAGRGLEGGG